MRPLPVGGKGSLMKKLLALALLIAPTASAVAADDDWTQSTSGGSTIQIPVSMTEGWVRALSENGQEVGTAFEPTDPPAQLRQYRTASTGSPFAYISAAIASDAAEITYSVDKPAMGVVSGLSADRSEIFYGMCRKAETVYCFDMHYPSQMQASFGPIVTRIAASFR